MAPKNKIISLILEIKIISVPEYIVWFPPTFVWRIMEVKIKPVLYYTSSATHLLCLQTKINLVLIQIGT